jgi:capsular polysaccharide biosynthesis protein
LRRHASAGLATDLDPSSRSSSPNSAWCVAGRAPSIADEGRLIDLAHFIHVTFRYKLTVAVGFLLAVGLTFLALYRVDYKHGFKVSHRQAETYQASATVFVTQPGFPWGRTITQYLPGDSKTARPSVPVADENRLATLTALYAQLAVSKPIRDAIPGVNEGTTKLSVTPVPAPPYVNPAILPLLTITVITPTPAGAVALANMVAEHFQGWLARRQAVAAIPELQRVSVQIVDPAEKAKLAGHRSKTLPAVIFLGLMAATFGFVFVRENLNPRVRAVADEPEPVRAPAPSRLAS